MYFLNHESKGENRLLISRCNTDGAVLAEKNFLNVKTRNYIYPTEEYSTEVSADGKVVALRYSCLYKDKETKKPLIESKLVVLDEQLNTIAEFNNVPAYFGETNGKQDEKNQMNLFAVNVQNNGCVIFVTLNKERKKNYTFYDKTTLTSWQLPDITLPDNGIPLGDLNFTTSNSGEIHVFGFYGNNSKIEGIFYSKIDREKKGFTEPVLSTFNNQNSLHNKLDVSSLKHLKIASYYNISTEGQLIIFEEQFVSTAYARAFHKDENDPFYNDFGPRELTSIFMRSNVLMVMIDEEGKMKYSAAMPKIQTESLSGEQHLHAAGVTMHLVDNKTLVFAYLDNPKAKGDFYACRNTAIRNDAKAADLVIERFDIGTGERISKKSYRPDFDLKNYEIQPLSIFFKGDEAYFIIAQSHSTYDNFLGKINY